MGLFDGFKKLLRGERGPMTPDEAIEAFWAWWAERESDLANVVGVNAPDWMIEEMSAAVKRIDEGLAWEFGPGRSATHALAVTGEGDPKLRMLAERWRRRGPSDGPVFEFHSARQPLPADRLLHYRMRMHELDVGFDGFRCHITRDETRAVIDVGVHHPAFDGTDREIAMSIAFIALDQALGEDGVERWIGAVDLLPASPVGGVDLCGLADAVRAFCEQCRGEDKWVLARGEQDGHRLIFVLNPGLKRWDHPFKDTWCVMALGYLDRGDGMPDDAEKLRVDALEEALLDDLGEAAANIGRATGGGRRQVFLYVDGASDTAERMQDWARRCVPPAHLTVEPDPGWHRRPG